MKTHYFEQELPDADDILLIMAQQQGYVASSCLLGGAIVMGLVNNGKYPCNGCNVPIDKCSNANGDNQ